MSSSTTATNSSGGRAYYEGDVDFDVLAAKDPEFAAICKVSKNKRWVDFQNPKVVKYELRAHPYYHRTMCWLTAN